MKKKVSISTVIVIAAIVGAICFASAYFIAVGNINSKIVDLNERKAIYDTLSEVDLAVRQNYKEDINEEELQKLLIEGYIKGVDEEKILYLTPKELSDGNYEKSPLYKVVKMSNGNALVFIN